MTDLRPGGSTSRWLATDFGGNWKWTSSRWQCDDGRYVAREAAGYNIDGEPVGIRYVLYTNGHPRRLYKIGRRLVASIWRSNHE